MTTPRFKNEDGTLTIYSFGCGYIESYELDQWRIERNKPLKIEAFNSSQSYWLEWEFPNAATARRFYLRGVRKALIAHMLRGAGYAAS